MLAVAVFPFSQLLRVMLQLSFFCNLLRLSGSGLLERVWIPQASLLREMMQNGVVVASLGVGRAFVRKLACDDSQKRCKLPCFQQGWCMLGSAWLHGMHDLLNQCIGNAIELVQKAVLSLSSLCMFLLAFVHAIAVSAA